MPLAADQMTSESCCSYRAMRAKGTWKHSDWVLGQPRVGGHTGGVAVFWEEEGFELGSRGWPWGTLLLPRAVPVLHQGPCNG